MKLFRLLLAGLLVTASSYAAQLPQVIEQVSSEVDANRAMRFLRQLWETDRWFTFPRFQQTAQTLQRAMSDIGLLKVEVLEAPADGVTQVGYWTMPLAWDVRSARLEIADPEVPEQFHVLADYGQIPASLCMWSGPTLPGGIDAELIEAAKNPEQQNWKGKIVLTNENPAEIKWLLAHKGAAGAINAFSENPDLRHDRQWINAWGDRGWAFTKDNAPLPCFSVSPAQHEYLRKLLSGGSVRLRAAVDSRYYSGVYPYVTGLLPGTGDQEVLVLGHTSEQGAHDNATGVAAMIEAMGALNRSVTAGKLPRPRRSIRMLAMGEMYGSMHYVATYPDRVSRTVAALCLDTPAATYELAGTEYTFHLNPHSASSFVDAFILKVADTYYGRRRPWHVMPYVTGTDNYLSDPMIGIPIVWPYSGTGIHTHHNSADRPETVDTRSLKDLAILAAAYLYYLAAADETHVAWLAELAVTRGQEEILKATSSVLDDTPGSDSQSLGRLLYQGKERIEYTLNRARQAVNSVSRLLPQASNPAWLGGLEKTLAESARLQTQRIKAAIAGRAAQLGLARVEPIVPPPDEQTVQARSLVVRRKRFGTLPLDDLPLGRREGQPNGAWADIPVRALYWCDGRRTLAEVIRLTRLEAGPTEFDFVAYFRFLEKNGYVEFATP